MVVFVSNFDGKSKKEGRPFHTVTLVEVRFDTDDNGELYVTARSKEFFTPKAIDCSMLKFGDIVSAEFQMSQFLGAAPDLVSLRKVSDSPYDFLSLLAEEKRADAEE